MLGFITFKLHSLLKKCRNTFYGYFLTHVITCLHLLWFFCDLIHSVPGSLRQHLWSIGSLAYLVQTDLIMAYCGVTTVFTDQSTEHHQAWALEITKKRTCEACEARCYHPNLRVLRCTLGAFQMQQAAEAKPKPCHSALTQSMTSASPGQAARGTADT